MEEYENLIGKYIGKCKIVDFITQGALGSVFHGYHETLERKVAIKILNKSVSEEYFLANSNQIAALEHENICSIYDIVFDEEIQKNCIIEQWIQEKSLRRRIDDKLFFSLDEFITLTMSIAETLAYAHNQGVVHGNLRPENFIKTADNQIHLKDFALVPAEIGVTQTLFGSKGYMAPEQEQRSLPSPASDIFNLGCTLFELLTGKLPVGYDKNDETALTVENIDLLPEEIPSEIILCLKRMLACDSSKRYQNAKELLEEIKVVFVKFDKVTCPQCGRRNSHDEVFTCKKCCVDNLCLHHLVPHSRTCEKCMETKRISHRIFHDNRDVRVELKGKLRNIANNNKQGVFIFYHDGKTTGLHITASGIEMCFDIPEKEVFKNENSYDDKVLLSQKIIQKNIIKILTAKDFSSDFWENSVPQQILPKHNVFVSLPTSSSGFLIRFSQILEIIISITNVGGIQYKNEKGDVTLFFTENGIIIYRSREEGVEILEEDSQILTTLQTFIEDENTSAKYISIPPVYEGADKLTGGKSLEAELLSLLLEPNSWGKLGSMIPEIQTVLPYTNHPEKPFGNITLSQISTVVLKHSFRDFTPDTLEQELDISKLNIYFLISTIAKNFIFQAVKRLVGLVLADIRMKNAVKIEILKEARKLSPQNFDILYQISQIYQDMGELDSAVSYLKNAANIHWELGNFGLALRDYEKAVALSSHDVEARLRLIKLYRKISQKDKVINLGLKLLPDLSSQEMYDEVEDVCLFLLQYDDSLILCRKELLKIYIMRGDDKRTTEQYEHLLYLYDRAQNNSAVKKVIYELLCIDSKRDDLKARLKIMGVKNWRTIGLSTRSEKILRILSLAGVGIFIFCFVLLWIRERNIYHEYISLQSQNITIENIDKLEQKAISIAKGIYFSSTPSKALKMLQKISDTRKDMENRSFQVNERVLFQGIEKNIDFYKDRKNEEKIYKLILSTISRFKDENIKKRLNDYILKYYKYYEQHLTKNALIGSCNFIWQFDVASEIQSLFKKNNTLYIFTKQGVLFSLGQDGLLRWKLELKKGKTYPQTKFKQANIEFIYHLNILYCLDLSLGKLVWKKELSDIITNFVMAKEHIYFITKQSKLLCLNLRGEVMKSLELKKAVYNDILLYREKALILSTKEGSFYYFHLARNKILFERHIAKQIYAPLLYRKRLYLLTKDSHLLKLNLRFKIAWDQSFLKLKKLIPKWRKIFLVGSEKELLCLKYQDGEQLWKREFDSPIITLYPMKDLTFVALLNKKIDVIYNQNGKTVWKSVLKSKIKPPLIFLNNKIIFGVKGKTIQSYYIKK